MQVVAERAADDLRRRPQRRGRRRAGRVRCPRWSATGRSSRVIAILDDKDANGHAALAAAALPAASSSRAPSNPRSLPPGTLESLAAQLDGPPRRDGRRPARGASTRARELAGPDGAVVATGSIYLIADLVREPGVARASTL